MGTSSRRRAPRCLLPIRGSTPNPGDDGRRVSYDSDSLDSVPCRVLDSAAWSRFDADDSRADRSFAAKSASPRSQLPRSRRSRDSDPSAERKAWIGRFGEQHGDLPAAAAISAGHRAATHQTGSLAPGHFFSGVGSIQARNPRRAPPPSLGARQGRPQWRASPARGFSARQRPRQEQLRERSVRTLARISHRLTRQKCGWAKIGGGKL